MIIYLAGGFTGNLAPMFRLGSFDTPENRRKALNEYLGRDTPLNMRLEDASILESFFYLAGSHYMYKYIPWCKSFLLDSGAFTFMQQTKTVINWERYILKYAEFIKTHKITEFVELDIDVVVGYDKVKIYRKILETKTEMQSIPVWHYGRGKEEFINHCKEYNRVALGGMISNPTYKRRIREYLPWFIDTAHKYDCKIHGLGFTSIPLLRKYRFDSVDSTTWLQGNRTGSIMKYVNRRIIRHYPEKTHCINSRMVSLNNFIEWVKFGLYAEKYL